MKYVRWIWSYFTTLHPWRVMFIASSKWIWENGNWHFAPSNACSNTTWQTKHGWTWIWMDMKGMDGMGTSTFEHQHGWVGHCDDHVTSWVCLLPWHQPVLETPYLWPNEAHAPYFKNISSIATSSITSSSEKSKMYHQRHAYKTN